MSADNQIDFSAVLASSVHDMKNSLCMIIQSLENLAQEVSADNPSYADKFSSLHYEASRLNGGLIHLLALYRHDLDAMPLNVDEVFVEELFDELIAKNDLYIESKGIELETCVETDLAWYFDFDLVMNLINDVLVNAMRYSENKIRLSAAITEQHCLQITIEDNGCGYPQDLLNSSANPTDKRNLQAGRTGLGLYFASMIAKAHRVGDTTGSIKLTNGGDLGGSVFTLTLP